MGSLSIVRAAHPQNSVNSADNTDLYINKWYRQTQEISPTSTTAPSMIPRLYRQRENSFVKSEQNGCPRSPVRSFFTFLPSIHKSPSINSLFSIIISGSCSDILQLAWFHPSFLLPLQLCAESSLFVRSIKFQMCDANLMMRLADEKYERYLPQAGNKNLKQASMWWREDRGREGKGRGGVNRLCWTAAFEMSVTARMRQWDGTYLVNSNMFNNNILWIRYGIKPCLLIFWIIATRRLFSTWLASLELGRGRGGG